MATTALTVAATALATVAVANKKIIFLGLQGLCRKNFRDNRQYFTMIVAICRYIRFRFVTGLRKSFLAGTIFAYIFDISVL